MILVTQRQLISSLKERWDAQNSHRDSSWHLNYVSGALAALDLQTASVEDVIRSMGGRMFDYHWIFLPCYACLEEVDAVVQLAHDTTFAEGPFNVCFSCLNKATSLNPKP